MVRSKVVYNLISDARSRKQTLRKRKAGLFKKANEIKTLCDTDVCVIISNQGSDKVDVWPSKNEVKGVLEKFKGPGTMLSARTKLNQEGQLEHCIEKLKKDIEKEEKINKQCEMELLMLNCVMGRATADNLEDPADLSLALEKGISLIDQKKGREIQTDLSLALPGTKAVNVSVKGKEKMFP